MDLNFSCDLDFYDSRISALVLISGIKNITKIDYIVIMSGISRFSNTCDSVYPHFQEIFIFSIKHSLSDKIVNKAPVAVN